MLPKVFTPFDIPYVKHMRFCRIKNANRDETMTIDDEAALARKPVVQIFQIDHCITDSLVVLEIIATLVHTHARARADHPKCNAAAAFIVARNESSQLAFGERRIRIYVVYD